MKLSLACVVLAALAPASLAQSSLYELHATQALESFGSSMCVGGDFDGDGFRDLIVGAEGHNGPMFDSGAIFLFSGADGSLLRTIDESQFNARLGGSVADAGDVDGDGVSDVLGGKHGSTPEYARVWSGATGAVLRTYSIGGLTTWYGSTVANVGDADGDGRDDHLVGAYHSNIGFPNAGAAYLYSGSSGTPIRVHAGSQTDELYGTALAALGDVDADGRADYAIGAPDASPGGLEQAGRVEIRSGATGGLIRAFSGSAVRERTGIALASAGELDGGGVEELAIGCSPLDPASGPPIYLPSRVLIVSTVSGATLRSLAAGCDEPLFGMDLAPARDFDGDGLADLAVPSTRGARVFSGADGAELAGLRDLWTTSWPLRSAWLPDVTGDGRPELVLASTVFGRVQVYLDTGTPAHLPGFCFGDGSGAPCPCGNSGATGQGCANSTGAGAELTAFGLASVADDKLWARLDGIAPTTRAFLFADTTATPPAVFHDGLRCIGPGSAISVKSTCAAGSAWFGPGLIGSASWNAGTTMHLQVFYRNLSGGPCGGLANASNAVSVTIVP